MWKLVVRLLPKYVSFVTIIGQIVFEETSAYQYALDLTENNDCIYVLGRDCDFSVLIWHVSYIAVTP
jgi:hypothetical protein